MFTSAQSWVRSIAKVLNEEGFVTVLVDTNWDNVTESRKAGCRAYYANILSENLLFDIQLDGIGRLLAMTPNDEVNSLASLRFEDIFGRGEVYQLSPIRRKKNSDKEAMPLHLRGRYLFDNDATYQNLITRFQSRAVVKKTNITEEFDYQKFREMYGESALPIFVITESNELKVCSAETTLQPEPNQTLISIVDPIDE